MKIIKKEIKQLIFSEEDIKNWEPLCGESIDFIIINGISQFDLSDKYPDFCKCVFPCLNIDGIIIFTVNNICIINNREDDF
jgi:hypothetical protein